jgi:NhaA family Na+:H+ antiporter
MQQLGVRSFLAYSIIGVLVWSGFFHSGVHATVAGVLLGLVTPAKPHVKSRLFQRFLRRAGDELIREAAGHEPQRAGHVRSLRRATRERVSPIEYLEHVLHPWVAFAILPVFALANAGVHVDASKITDPIALAVALGLIIGKPVGISGFSWLAVRAGIARLPSGAGWPTIVAASVLGGIGFTMALFIAGLALDGGARDAAKVGILGASIIAAGAGMALLRWTLPAPVSAPHLS